MSSAGRRGKGTRAGKGPVEIFVYGSHDRESDADQHEQTSYEKTLRRARCRLETDSHATPTRLISPQGGPRTNLGSVVIQYLGNSKTLRRRRLDATGRRKHSRPIDNDTKTQGLGRELRTTKK